MFINAVNGFIDFLLTMPPLGWTIVAAIAGMVALKALWKRPKLLMLALAVVFVVMLSSGVIAFNG